MGTTHEFKVGDKVRRKPEKRDAAMNAQVWTVSRANGKWLELEEYGDGEWFSRYFDLVEDAPEPVADPQFKVGDKVRRTDGKAFSNGEHVVTVSSLTENVWDKSLQNVWFKETATWEGADQLELHVEATPKLDPVSKPAHYNYGKVETIDYIMQVCALYPGHQAALVGNVIKYLSRAPLKGDKEKDLKKAQWYLNKLIETLV